MLYLDYSRREGEWVPNRYGGRENLDAIEFVRQMNMLTHAEQPGSITIAEESTAFPSVSRPTYLGGLGFTYKWNMGWMNDILEYVKQGSRLPPLGPLAPDVLAALRLHRELHPAVLARRSRARQGLDVRQDPRRRLAEGGHAARALRLHVRAPGQEADVHGLRVRPGARVELRSAASTGTCSRIRCTPGCGASSAISIGPTPPSRRCTRWTSIRTAFSGSTATTTRTASSRSSAAAAEPERLRRRAPELHAGAARRLPHRRARAPAATSSCSTAMPKSTAAATRQRRHRLHRADRLARARRSRCA